MASKMPSSYLLLFTVMTCSCGMMRTPQQEGNSYSAPQPGVNLHGQLGIGMNAQFQGPMSNFPEMGNLRRFNPVFGAVEPKVFNAYLISRMKERTLSQWMSEKGKDAINEISGKQMAASVGVNQALFRYRANFPDATIKNLNTLQPYQVRSCFTRGGLAVQLSASDILLSGSIEGNGTAMGNQVAFDGKGSWEIKVKTLNCTFQTIFFPLNATHLTVKNITGPRQFNCFIPSLRRYDIRNHFMANVNGQNVAQGQEEENNTSGFSHSKFEGLIENVKVVPGDGETSAGVELKKEDLRGLEKMLKQYIESTNIFGLIVNEAKTFPAFKQLFSDIQQYVVDILQEKSLFEILNYEKDV